LSLSLALLVWRGVAKHGNVCRNDHSGRLRRFGSIDDCELVVAELPEKNGDREAERWMPKNPARRPLLP